jgi:hypothetical protein
LGFALIHVLRPCHYGIMAKRFNMHVNRFLDVQPTQEPMKEPARGKQVKAGRNLSSSSQE